MSTPTPSISESELLENLGWIQVLARTLVRDGSTADDVMQDTWLRALEHPPRAREGAGLRAWLARVTQSRARTNVRSARRRAYHEAVEPQTEALPSTLEVVERASTQRVVVEELMRLGEPDRSTVLQRYLDGMTAAEIARARGESPAAVRKRLSRAMATLRARLEPRFGGREALFGSLVAFGRPTEVAPLLGVKSMALAATFVGVSALAAWVVLSGPDRTPETEIAAAEVGLAPPQESAPQDPAPVVERTPVAPAGLSFAGRVLDLPFPGLTQELAPAAGIEVTLTIGDPGPVEKLVRKTTTDAAGRFLFEVREPVARTVEKPARASLWIAASDERRFARKTLYLKPDDDVPAEIELLRAAHGNARGVVVDASGAPIEGVVLTTRATWGLGASPVPTESVSDEEGQFDLGVVSDGFELSASKPGWRQLEDVAGVREEAGGWKPVRIVMASAGALLLEVVDEAGVPSPGVTVVAGVSLDEPSARRESSLRVEGQTNAEGRVLLEDVWTDVKLRLQVRTRHGSFESERTNDDELATPGRQGDQAIVVPSGGVLELLARTPRPHRVAGHVVDAAGDAVPGAAVLLLLPNELTYYSPGELDGDPDGFGRRLAIQADEQGRFEQHFLLRAQVEELRLVATNGATAQPVLFNAGREDYTSATSRTFPIEEFAPGNESDVELVLEPVLSIRGFVLDRDSLPVSGQIGFKRPGEVARTRIDGAKRRIEDDGSFEITGLLQGPHDLEVGVKSDYFFTWSRVPRRFPGIEAGAQGVELVLEEPELVNITIAASLDGESVKFAGLLGQHLPYEPRSSTGATPREVAFERLDGWPASATLSMGYGQAGGRSNLGVERYMYFGSSEEPSTFEPVAPGWYRIGVRGWDASGQALHPSGTGLVYLESGDYRFDFTLVRMGDVRGQVTGKLHPDLCVGLLDARGRPVHTRRNQKFMGPTSPLGADGGFWLQDAPAGSYVLVVGTAEAVLAGRGLHRQQVEVQPGAELFLTIELP